MPKNFEANLKRPFEELQLLANCVGTKEQTTNSAINGRPALSQKEEGINVPYDRFNILSMF